MKKNTSLLVFYLIISLVFFTAISSFGQSLIITPAQTVSENTSGDNIILRGNNSLVGLQSLRYNGTAASKSPILGGNVLLRLGAGGYASAGTENFERAFILFLASHDWNSTSHGTGISFWTTGNTTTTATERMIIGHNGNVGIGNPAPTSKLHITSLSAGDPFPPEIHLQATAIAEELGSTVYIKSSSTNVGGGWTNEIENNSHPLAGEVRWIHSPTGNTPLTLAGSGDAFIQKNARVGGYTKLGGFDAPAIKMKKLTATTSGTSGGEVGVAHGLSQDKILSVSVLVNGAAGNDIAPNTSFYAGYEYTFYVSSSGIFIQNSAGNHSSIAARPAKILITYEE